jgi:ADP-ribosylation factor-binding protein GGA
VQQYNLELQPQSSLVLTPNQKNGITQSIKIRGVQQGQGSKVRMRWKVGYSLGGLPQEESGAVDGLPGNL